MATRPCFLCVIVFLVFFSFLSGEDDLKILDDDSFEHLTQAATGATTGDWLIVFSKDHKDCSQCKDVEDILVKLNEKFKHKLSVAKVFPSKSKLTLKRFEVTKWPAVSLFHHGRQYYYTSDNYTEESLTEFLDDYQKRPNRKVPQPLTIFDVIIDDLMNDVKHIVRWRKNAAVVIFCSGILFGLMLMPILKCLADFLILTFSYEGDKEETDDDERKDDDEDEDEDEDEERKDDEEGKNMEHKKDD